MSAATHAPFGLGVFEHHGDTFTGVVVADQVHDLRPHLGARVTSDALLHSWDASVDQVRALLPGLTGGVPIQDVRLLPPVRPGQILCAGANYHRHVEQIVFTMTRNAGDSRTDDELRAFAREEVRSRQSAPFFFPGSGAAISGANDDVVLWGPGTQHDWELELAVVIGRTAHRIAPEDAWEHVAGFTISNDITVRDVMTRPDMPLTDYVMSKNRPTFFPTGPYIVPKRFVGDHLALRLTLAVNGRIMQDDLVADVIHDVPALISYASHATILSPGDLILTGSPAGNAGHHGNAWLRPGDVIESTITGLGAQRNLCVAPPPGSFRGGVVSAEAAVRAGGESGEVADEWAPSSCAAASDELGESGRSRPR
jgi:2,4-didehydro-3-deoxy-L-rhamnonate hydrolase